jgi:hypothetical protein
MDDPGDAVGLTGIAPRPDGEVIGHPGPSQAEGEAADAREEVDLIEAGEVSRVNVSDVSLIDDSGRDPARRDPQAEHPAGVGVDVVVVRGQTVIPSERAKW